MAILFDDAVPEFVLYWRERGETIKTLNSKFINHILRQWARYSSALGVETFLKKSSLISYSKEALASDTDDIEAMANLEGLSAHALSVAIRREVSEE